MLRLCEAERKGELMESAVCCPGSPWTISRLKVQPDGSPSTSSVASVVCGWRIRTRGSHDY